MKDLFGEEVDDKVPLARPNAFGKPEQHLPPVVVNEGEPKTVPFSFVKESKDVTWIFNL